MIVEVGEKVGEGEPDAIAGAVLGEGVDEGVGRVAGSIVVDPVMRKKTPGDNSPGLLPGSDPSVQPVTITNPPYMAVVIAVDSSSLTPL